MLLLALGCLHPKEPAVAAKSPDNTPRLERVALDSGEVWRGEVGISFARDVLGDAAVDACLTELEDTRYDTCAMRLHNCLTVVVSGPEDATVVLDAEGCGADLPSETWLVVDHEGEAKPRVVKP
ncbi:MAG: hypothetical protein VX899_23610 [Myxococcota bacterium]|nr:hypothetical protein [Myxococcota bacterium]